MLLFIWPSGLLGWSLHNVCLACFDARPLLPDDGVPWAYRVSAWYGCQTKHLPIIHESLNNTLVARPPFHENKLISVFPLLLSLGGRARRMIMIRRMSCSSRQIHLYTPCPLFNFNFVSRSGDPHLSLQNTNVLPGSQIRRPSNTALFSSLTGTTKFTLRPPCVLAAY